MSHANHSKTGSYVPGLKLIIASPEDTESIAMAIHACRNPAMKKEAILIPSRYSFALTVPRRPIKEELISSVLQNDRLAINDDARFVLQSSVFPLIKESYEVSLGLCAVETISKHSDPKYTQRGLNLRDRLLENYEPVSMIELLVFLGLLTGDGFSGLDKLRDELISKFDDEVCIHVLEHHGTCIDPKMVNEGLHSLALNPKPNHVGGDGGFEKVSHKSKVRPHNGSEKVFFRTSSKGKILLSHASLALGLDIKGKLRSWEVNRAFPLAHIDKVHSKAFVLVKLK